MATHLKSKLNFICKLSFAAILLAGVFAFVPKQDDPLDKLIAALQKWATDVPQEKVYLQIDKPYYALGDTIWFKGYITTGSRHQLSAISGSVYVDLINERDSLIKSLKLPATSGMVMGDFTLTDELKQGNYRIRAYTQWMRNAGEEYFFDKTITVGSVFSNGINTKANYAYKDVDNKSVLTATLNYTDDQGKPIVDKSVLYRITIDKKVVWTKNAKTDANGNIQVAISNENKVDLSGAYIRTTLTNSSNKEVVKDFPIKAGLSQSDVQFFPESGNMINGIASRVAFKATGVDGLGLNITGKIIDNDNKEIAAITTTHAGMGNFQFKPEAGKSYTAKINFADGSTKSIVLPKANDEGYVLSVYQPNKDSVLVRIYAGAQQPQTPTSVNLVAQTGGEVIAASAVKIEKQMTSVWMAKKDFPTGIAQFTLFNNNNEALNERLAFIRSNDLLNLSIKTNKSSFKSKEPVFFSMDARDGSGKPTIGNFSVSVIDETKIPADEVTESTIMSNLLLSSDIKGYVEQPNYYFAKESKEVNDALDNLMLTQGYRRFVWKELTDNIVNKPKFAAEDLGFVITGKVQNLSHKPVPNANVTLLSVRAKVTKFATTDSLGRFKFDGMFLTDSISFAIQGRTQKNSDKLIVTLDTLPKLRVNKNPNISDITNDLGTAMKAYLDAAKKQDELYAKMGRMDMVHRLREVEIKAEKAKKEVYAVQGSIQVPDGHQNKSYLMKDEDAEKNATLALALSGKLGPVMFSDSKPIYGGSPMTVVLNGREVMGDEVTDIFELGTIDIGDIVKVDVLYGKFNPLLKFYGKTAMLFLYTKPNYMRKPAYNPSMVNITPKGFNRAREFYMPKYNAQANLKEPDLRSTIYWNPYLKTDADGKSSFSFFNADGPGTYKVIVEGINADGQLGRQVFRYQVEGELMGGSSAASVTVKDDRAKLIASSLDSLQKRMPVEKVYLHTDKSYYNIGDTLWFKSYLMDARNLPSKQSGLLYVELDDDSTEAVRRISIPIKEGLGWGQIPLPKTIFHEGGYTLKAYTNWMQNFGSDVFFTQRFYLGIPAQTAWLVKSTAAISRAADKDQLDVDISLTHGNKSPIALRDVEVRIYEGKYYLFKQKMRTGVDGSLKFSQMLKDKVNSRNLRVEVHSLEKADNDKVVQIPLNINRPQKIDLQFLPEGGKLVAGLKSTVGFKALGEDGKGLSVAFDLFDSKGNKVDNLVSTHNGMGSFEFTPIAGETYSAKITQPVQLVDAFALPAVNALGTVMHIDNLTQANDLIITLAGIDKLNADSAYYLIGTTGGRVYYSQQIDSKQTSVTVAKSQFPSGITRFTLLKGKRPLNERAVYIDNQDKLNFKIVSNKSGYLKRDSVAIDVAVTDQSGMPVAGSFSLAVTDNTQVKADSAGNYSIGTSLLLNAELKGSVENPGYYLNPKNKQAWQDLDNLMLTQGWTGYDWKDVFGPAKQALFAAEKEFKVTGLVTNLTKKPVPGMTVLISSQKPSFYTTATTDAAGRYLFNKLPQIDTGSFFIQAKNANGKNMAFGNVSVEKFRAPDVPETYKDNITPWYVNSDTTQLNYVKRVVQKQDDANVKAAGTLLKNVDIKSGKIIKESFNRNGPGNADLVFDEEDIKKSSTVNLYQLIKQKISGIRVTIEHSMPTLRLGTHLVVIHIDGGGLPIMFDGRPNAADMIAELSNFQVAQFTGMEVNYSDKNTLMYMMPRDSWINARFSGAETVLSEENVLNGEGNRPWLYKPGYAPGYLEARANVATNNLPDIAAIDITTKNGKGWYRDRSPSTVTYRPLPLSFPQQFYSPKYKLNEPIKGEPDYRSTIFWEPNLITDANGKARVKFYTSDLPQDYTVNMQGASTDGHIGGAVTKLSAGKQVPNKEPLTGAISLPSKVKADQSKLIASSPDSLNRKLPLEKVYLHTDKPYYNIGDTLWFKSYLTDARNHASKQSGLLYVELDDDSSEVVRRITIPIKDGRGWGQIPLPKKIFHEGGYTLKAYTNWMQNFGPDVFFTRRFYLGMPTDAVWLVKSEAALKRVDDKDRLDVEIRLNRGDRKPVTLTNVEVRLYDGAYYLYREEMRTGVDGSIKFSKILKDKAVATNLRVQITSLEKADKNKIIQVPLTINRAQKIDLQFLPEGGNLVAGLQSTVGFKAIGEDGNGTTVAGAVYDSKGTKISDFTSLYKGMGSVRFTPKAGEKYTAKITQPEPVVKVYTLPQVSLTGTVMHVVNPEKEQSLSIELAGISKMTADSACYLVATAAGKVCYQEQIDGKRNKFEVDKSLFPTGIARFTLLKGKKPLNERVVFIDHNDRLGIKMTSNKPVFAKRDSVALEIEVKDAMGMPVQGDFSLAVTDNLQVRSDTSGNYNIGTQLLLNSNLKGNVETPNYYLTRRNAQAWQALDNLMLTQGWVGYDWKDVFAPTVTPAFVAEKEFKITGSLVNLTNKPLPSSIVIISSQKPSFTDNTITDAQGKFTFSNLPQIDSGSFFLQGKNEKGKNLTFGGLNINRFHPPAILPMAVGSILPWYVNTDTTQLNYLARAAETQNLLDPKSAGTLLKNVNIKTVKVIPGSWNGWGPADLSFDEKDIKESAVMTLYQLLKQKIPGFRIMQDWVYHHGKTIIQFGDYYLDDVDCTIDAQPLFPILQLDKMGNAAENIEEIKDEISQFPIANLKGLEVIWDKKLLAGERSKRNNPPYWFAEIVITTKSGAGWYRRPDPATATYRPLPILYPQQFYSPQYAVKKPVLDPDHRSTIFWEPNVFTDMNGKAKVSFYTSDFPKDYTINIQGITSDGYTGSLIQKLSADKSSANN